ncbi:hypothetical protein ACFYY5_29365 [Nocardia elegans]|uniref:DUF2442 domain-containing protein n=1 Tax=Nocardia elegans TaxID=300029 RepID=A0ABW6TNZ9_9NOCA
MPQFEIHGDDKNGITIRIDGREQAFDLISYARVYQQACSINDSYWRDLYPRDIWPIQLDLKPRPEVLDATPTVYGEGTWLH